MERYERKIAKHAAIICLPPICLGGSLAVVSELPAEDFDGGILVKRILQGAFCLSIIGHAAFVVAYYYQKIEEKCRAPRRNEFVDVQPIRMQLYTRYHAPPSSSQEIRRNDEGDVYEDTYV